MHGKAGASILEHLSFSLHSPLLYIEQALRLMLESIEKKGIEIVAEKYCCALVSAQSRLAI